MLNLSESGELAAFWSSKYRMLPGKLFGILQRRLFVKERRRRREKEKDRISWMAARNARKSARRERERERRYLLFLASPVSTSAK